MRVFLAGTSPLRIAVHLPRITAARASAYVPPLRRRRDLPSAIAFSSVPENPNSMGLPGESEGEVKKGRVEKKEPPPLASSPPPPPALVLQPPEKPLPGDCCGSGCVRCVWDVYYEELEEYNKALSSSKQ